MDIEIVGESVKTGLSVEILKKFPGIEVYKEFISKPTFPHFFIYQLTLDVRQERRNYWWLHYLMSLRYRVAAETIIARDLQAQLDATALSLMAINKIYLSDMPIRVRESRTEKVENVLHYFCAFDIHVTKEQIEKIKQWQVTINLNLKG